MSKAKQGDKVKVHYTGKLDDGTQFDSSVGQEPLEFEIGKGQVIKGFEKAVIGMEKGSENTINIPSSDAYGEYKKEMVVDIKKEQIPKDMEVKVGQMMQVKHPEGQVIPVTITKVEEEKVTIDANHPLAGKDLTFEIELVEIG